MWSKLEIKCHKILLFFEHYLDCTKLLRITKSNVIIAIVGSNMGLSWWVTLMKIDCVVRSVGLIRAVLSSPNPCLDKIPKQNRANWRKRKRVNSQMRIVFDGH